MSDTICREDAIKAIHNYWKKRLDTLPTKESECGEVYADIQQMDKILEHNKTLCNFINAIPSADRPQEWIPCSERVPSEFVDVLVCLADGTMDVVQLTDYIGIDGEPKWCHDTGYTLGGAILNSDVVAWMPLPKPWKGADDD